MDCRFNGRKHRVAIKPWPHTTKALSSAHHKLSWSPSHTLPSAVATVAAWSVETSHKFRCGYQQSQERGGPNFCDYVLTYENAAFSEQDWPREMFLHKRKSLLGFLDITGVNNILCFQMLGIWVVHELDKGRGAQLLMVTAKSCHVMLVYRLQISFFQAQRLILHSWKHFSIRGFMAKVVTCGLQGPSCVRFPLKLSEAFQ